MEDFLDCLSSIAKTIIIAIIIMLTCLGIIYLGSDRFVEEDITYIENGVQLNVFKYKNEIYIKKGE